MRGHTAVARMLRKQLTPEEQKLWRWLRNRRFGGWKFRRQFARGAFILDFFCVELKLAIELDGRGHDHPAAAARDRLRDRVLQRRGISVLRIRNELLRNQPQTVADQIEWKIERILARRQRS